MRPAKNMIDTLITEDAYGPNHFRVALTLRVYGAILRRQKRNGEAKLAERRARQILAKHGISLGQTIDVTALLPAGKVSSQSATLHHLSRAVIPRRTHHSAARVRARSA
jgi:hypothetical protein